MKKLFILRSILKDWFTTQLPYTAAVVVTLVFSFLALFFVAEKVATENLASLEFENVYYNQVCVNQDTVSSEDPAHYELYTGYLMTDEFMDRLVALGLPPFIDPGAGIGAYCKYTAKNGEKLEGTDFCELRSLPVFAPSESAYYERFRYQLESYQYEIVSGRDITPEELENHSRVVVAPEGYALAVGDKITMHGEEFEVIGLNRPSVYNEKDSEYMLVPYWYLNESMKNPLTDEEASHNHYNPAYDKKPKNNVYIPKEIDKDTIYIDDGHTNDDTHSYSAILTVDLINCMFKNKITEEQKTAFAAFLGIKTNQLTNWYNLSYHDNVNKYQDIAQKESIVVAAFCALNILMLIVFLCGKNVCAFRMFRVYGASRIHIFLLNFAAALVCILIALGIGVALSPQVLKLVSAVNSNYEFRPYCVKLAAAVFTVSAVFAAIPAAVSAVIKSPVRK
ncbi:MAG: ABC transporter permease [Oscillospiraceae bacterium]